MHGSALRFEAVLLREAITQQATDASEEPQLVAVFDDFDLASVAFRQAHHLLFDVEVSQFVDSTPGTLLGFLPGDVHCVTYRALPALVGLVCLRQNQCIHLSSLQCSKDRLCLGDRKPAGVNGPHKLFQAGAGLFAAPDVIEKEIRRQYGVRFIGRMESVQEQFYAISVERKVKHPAVVAIADAAREKLFG